MTRLTTIGLCIALAAACSADPQYLTPAEALEVGAPGTEVTEATTMVVLPVRIEEADEAMERAELAAELGVMVPYVRREDLDISLEWSVRNLSEERGQARILLNGANEYFTYVPEAFVVDPEEEEVPPPLAGDVPILVEPRSTVSGVLREDQLAEGALDLELITRSGLNPFTALLQVHEELGAIGSGGVEIPIDVTANLIRLDITFTADRHMVMEYAVRVRDHRRPNLIHEDGLAADPGELTGFAPADFAPALP